MKLSWIPNAICVVRIVLVAPIVWALVAEQFALALGLIVVAGGSDAADGFLAKRFDWRSRLGSLLDPAADKLLVTSVFITLTVLGLVPLVLTAIVLLRDFVIVTGVVVLHFFVAPANGRPTAISKLNTAFQLGFLVFTITQAAFGWPPAISITLLGAAVIFSSIVSGLDYVLGGLRSLRASPARTG